MVLRGHGDKRDVRDVDPSVGEEFPQKVRCGRPGEDADPLAREILEIPQWRVLPYEEGIEGRLSRDRTNRKDLQSAWRLKFNCEHRNGGCLDERVKIATHDPIDELIAARNLMGRDLNTALSEVTILFCDEEWQARGDVEVADASSHSVVADSSQQHGDCHDYQQESGATESKLLSGHHGFPTLRASGRIRIIARLL